MKVLALSADDGGCHFYRMAEPSRIARTLGVDVTNATGIDVDAVIDQRTGMTTIREVRTDADLIIIQRPMDNAFTSMLEQAKKQGIATIVELDDDLEMVHHRNVSHSFIYGDKREAVHPKWIKAACEVADHVTVSTPALQRYAPHGRSTVLRNCVPESIFDIKKERVGETKPVIGWTGTVQTHPMDLQETKGAVGQIATENGLSINIVGDGEMVQQYLRLSPRTPVHSTGWVALDNYYETLSANMDIGIVPLEKSAFNEAKSALKGLEMAALGIPFVASPTYEYRRMEAYGIGKVANGPGEWRRHLQRMIDRPAEVEKNVKHYQEVIYNEMCYERTAHQWVSVWEQAVEYRKTHPHG